MCAAQWATRSKNHSALSTDPIALAGRPEHGAGMDERKSWERQPEESDQAWAAFVAYRDTLPEDRSIGKGAWNWSSKHAWKERVAAWDLHADRALEGKRIGDIAEMRMRHGALAMEMLELAAIEVSKRLARAKAWRGETVDIKYLVELAEKAIRLERLVAGEAESRNEQQGTWAEIVAQAALPLPIDMETDDEGEGT